MEQMQSLCLHKELAIGVDLGGTNIKFALVDTTGLIIDKLEVPTQSQKGWEAVLESIYQGVTRILAQTNLSIQEIKGVGLGIPGLTNTQTGVVQWSPNLNWQEIPLGPWLRQRLNIPIVIDNDANMAAFGEFWAGGGKGYPNMVLLTIGTGIGGGVIIDGEILHGSFGGAGEIGHTVVLPKGPKCSCGNQGCLEALTAAPALIRRAEELLDSYKASSLQDVELITAKDIFLAAEQGDKLSLEIIDEMTYYLGIGIGNLINILNPGIVLIGGGVSRGGALIMNPLRKYALENTLPIPRERVKLEFAALGNDAGAIGAAGRLFTDKELS